MRIILALFAVLLLGACKSTQVAAPIVHYGASEGEGSGGVHNVSAGDTLYSISKRYKIAMRDIVLMNNLSAPFTLNISQRLKLPPPNDYKVRAGDTLYAVARIFDVSVNEVARVNNLQSPYTLRVGQVLTLPSAHPAIVATYKVPEKDVKAVPPPQVKRGQPLKEQSRYAVRAPAPAPPAKITAKTPARSSSKFLKPVNGRIVSSYGPKAGGLHNDGINIAAPRGTPVSAAENGVVVYVGSELKGSGNLVLIRHADRWMSAYGHLDKTSVTRGQVIKRGAKLGTVGSTGNVSSPQLHFEIRRGTQAINPARYL